MSKQQRAADRATPRDFRRTARGRSSRGALAPYAARAAIGLEAEFAVVVDGVQVTPEELFGTPRNIVRGPLMHRIGRSYHLPTGGAVYFDSGVIEIATPMIEIACGCAARAGRSLWESIHFLRAELDAWEIAHGKTVDLAGFSAHYNVSFDVPRRARGASRDVEQLARLLTHLLPAPVMMLAANRASTGVGVRPRGNRIEITADFTPDPALMIAAATVIVGIVRAVMRWPSYSESALATGACAALPRFQGFVPVPHSSRRGWVARYSCFTRNPFTADVNAPLWDTTGGDRLSLREIARRIVRYFWPSIRCLADDASLTLVGAVIAGRARSLLELDARPDAYERVGRLCEWDGRFPDATLSRSRYERVILRAIHGERLQLGDDDWYMPIGVRGWSQVVFRRERDRTRHVFSLDELVPHLDGWGDHEGR